MDKVSVFWFRRDLRLQDNCGLFHALEHGMPVLPIFIFDENILNELPKNDARVSFIHSRLSLLNSKLEKQGSRLEVYYGKPLEVWEKIFKNYAVEQVFCNHDYEPYALKRDTAIQELVKENGAEWHSNKDQVIFEKDEIVKDDASPYVVYTPFKNKWLQAYTEAVRNQKFPSQDKLDNCLKQSPKLILSLDEIGFEPTSIKIPKPELSEELVKHYAATRNFPSKERGTSKAGIHLRFGSISVRELARFAFQFKDKTYLQELIWREFFMQILYHFPKTVNQAFKPKYDNIDWRNAPDDFERWKKGETGFPLVDAGMRELNTTGYMHNRVRMLVASFLVKHLLIDWRLGEAYFAEKLLDFELASNVGNWQWAAGSGVDAAPYFRIFNPDTQLKKFDKNLQYVKKFIPEYGTQKYPEPMLDHKAARERCLARFKAALA